MGLPYWLVSALNVSYESTSLCYELCIAYLVLAKYLITTNETSAECSLIAAHAGAVSTVMIT